MAKYTFDDKKSKRKIMNYHVAHGTNLEFFQREVDHLLKNGYKPWGAMIWTGQLYCQAMILES